MELTIKFLSDRGKALWPVFAPHHYLSGRYSGHHAIAAFVGDQPVAFASSRVFPNSVPQPCRREHRTVVLPDYQGIGIGVRISDIMALAQLGDGVRYYSKTTNPAMGMYRNNSPLWRNIKSQTAGRSMTKTIPAFSHEFIGYDPAIYEWVLAQVKKPSEFHVKGYARQKSQKESLQI